MSLARHLPFVALLALAAPLVARAAPEQDVSEVMYNLGTSDASLAKDAPPRFVFGAKAMVQPSLEAAMGGLDNSGGFTGKTTGEQGVASWVGADFEGPAGTAHVLGLFEKVGDHWHAVTWQIARTATAADQAKALAAHARPDAFARSVDGDAQPAVKLLEAGLRDGAALAKSVADRDDVVVFGAEPGPRIAGAAAARTALRAWPSLKVTDGLQAGTIAGHSVAWVAANVATTAGKHTPYRLLAVYVKDHASWRLVAIQLAFVAS